MLPSIIGTSRAFLFLHLYEPHKPYEPPERFKAYAPYDGEIAYADEIVGRLVRYLKAHQLYDRATIVLLSDHGEGLGDHGARRRGAAQANRAIEHDAEKWDPVFRKAHAQTINYCGMTIRRYVIPQ